MGQPGWGGSQVSCSSHLGCRSHCYLVGAGVLAGRVELRSPASFTNAAVCRSGAGGMLDSGSAPRASWFCLSSALMQKRFSSGPGGLTIRLGLSHLGTWLGSAQGPGELHCSCSLGSGLAGPPSGSRVLLTKSSTPSVVYAAPRSLSHLGISTLPVPKGWCSHCGGGSPQQASVPHSRPWRSQQLTRRRAEGALCPVGPTWPVGPVGPVATRAAQKQPAPGRGWAGARPGSPCSAHTAGPSPAAAVLSVFRAAGSAHLSSHHQTSKEDSRERILALLHWRRRETEPRDCAQALRGMTWEAAEGARASGGPGAA